MIRRCALATASWPAAAQRLRATAGFAFCSRRLISGGDARDAASEGGMGQAFQKAGYESQMSTPSFGDVAAMPSPPDIGPVSTTPASNVTVEKDLAGPWILLSEKLQGELYIREDGYCFFRPGSMLGHGVGKIALNETSIGNTVFRVELEMYVYENTSRTPPNTTDRIALIGTINLATASQQGYSTFTLTGQVLRLVPSADSSLSSSSFGAATENLGQLNAAKMSPWDPKANPFWAPNAQIVEGFQQVFGQIPDFTSHIARVDKSRPKPQHLDLSKYRVGDLDCVYYVPNYVTEAEEQSMLRSFAETPKEFTSQLTKRTVQEWGCTMCDKCNMSFVADVNMPPWTSSVCNVLLHDGIFSPAMFPNNVRVHEYKVGEGIAPHVDGPIYIPRVAIMSLRSPCVMSFYKRREPYEQPMEHYQDTFRFDGAIAKEVPHMSLVLEPRSLLVFANDVYAYHPHGISDKAVDSLDPAVAGPIVNRHLLTTVSPTATEIHRDVRVGVTVRNLLPRCNHQPMRSEFCMAAAWRHYYQMDFGPPSTAKTSSAATISSASFPPKPTPKPQQPAAQPPQQHRPQEQPKGPSPAPAASRPQSHGQDAVIEQLARNQAEIVKTLQEMKQLLAMNTASQASFQREISTVLNYVSSTVLDVQASVEGLVEESAATSAAIRGSSNPQEGA